MFDNWIQGIYSTEGHVLGYKDDYAVDVVIQMLNKKDVPVYGVRLTHAYPIKISGFDLTQDKEGPVDIQIDWKYDKYIPEGPLSSTLSAANAVIDLIT